MKIPLSWLKEAVEIDKKISNADIDMFQLNGLIMPLPPSLENSVEMQVDPSNTVPQSSSSSNTVPQSSSSSTTDMYKKLTGAI